jgi:DNA polymerase III delta subunit
MKLTSSALSKITPRLGKDLFTLIFHGDNESSLRKSVDQIRASLPAHTHTTLHAGDWGKEGEVLYDLMLTPSLMGGDPCVIVRAESGLTEITAPLLDLGKQLRYGLLVVVTSGTLKATHALRKWAEADERAGIVGFYEDSPATCMAALRQGLSDYTLDPDAWLFAEKKLATQMSAVEAAVQTLPLLVYPRRTITLQDMRTLALDHDDHARDLAFAYLMRPKSYSEDLAAFVKSHAQAQPTPYIMVIRAVMDILRTLHTLHLGLKTSHNSLDAAITALRPPLFFKDKPNLLALMKKYDQASVIRGLQHSLGLEKALKSKPVKVACLMFEHG